MLSIVLLLGPRNYRGILYMVRGRGGGLKQEGSNHMYLSRVQGQNLMHSLAYSLFASA